jgi:hypothetical protein
MRKLSYVIVILFGTFAAAQQTTPPPARHNRREVGPVELRVPHESESGLGRALSSLLRQSQLSIQNC